ncbi:MAG: hypothetical protein ABJA83_15765 [Burkholderiaceae bacterium]
MTTIRLGLFQESTDRFTFALHADTSPMRLYQEFSAHDLRTAIMERPGSGASVQLVSVPAEVSQIRDLVFERMSREPESIVTGGMMALDTVSDSWHLTVLRDFMPSYHVALAFSFFPLRVSFGEGNLVHNAYDVAPEADAGAAWYMLCPAVAAQAASIVFRDAPTGADACALLAKYPGVVRYLLGLGDTFSLSDVEQLARRRQVTSSVVSAAAQSSDGEDRSWLYRVKLSERAVASAELLAVSYARENEAPCRIAQPPATRWSTQNRQSNTGKGRSNVLPIILRCSSCALNTISACGHVL